MARPVLVLDIHCAFLKKGLATVRVLQAPILSKSEDDEISIVFQAENDPYYTYSVSGEKLVIFKKSMELRRKKEEDVIKFSDIQYPVFWGAPKVVITPFYIRGFSKKGARKFEIKLL